MEQQKIVFSLTKIGGDENSKQSGSGYIIGTNVYIPCISTSNKMYIKVLEDATNYCHPLINADGQFKGLYTEIVEWDAPAKNGSTDRKEISVDYVLWYKKVD